MLSMRNARVQLHNNAINPIDINFAGGGVTARHVISWILATLQPDGLLTQHVTKHLSEAPPMTYVSPLMSLGACLLYCPRELVMKKVGNGCRSVI